MSSQAPCPSHHSVVVEESSRRWNATPLEYVDISISSKRRKPPAFTCIDSVLVNTSLSNDGSFTELLDAQWKQVPVHTNYNTIEGEGEGQLKQLKRPRWQPPRRLTAVEEAALYTSPPRIRIGLNYQVEHLPVVGQQEQDNSQQEECSSPACLWDPQRAAAAMAAGQDIGAYNVYCNCVQRNYILCWCDDCDWIYIKIEVEGSRSSSNTYYD